MAVTDYEMPTPMRTFHAESKSVSIAHARDVLIRERKLFEDSLAQVRAIAIRFPSGEVASSIVLIAQEIEAAPSWGAELPISKSFIGRSAAGHTETFDISVLDRAWADGNCIVELTDGLRLEAVQVIPARICTKLTLLQRRIVYWTLNLVGAEHRCFGYGEPNPELLGLDYSKLHGLELPRLNEIAHYIARQDRTLKNVSHQTIADSLAACGMRRPRSGRFAVEVDAAKILPDSN